MLMISQADPVYTPSPGVVLLTTVRIQSFNGGELTSHTFEALGLTLEGRATAVHAKTLSVARGEQTGYVKDVTGTFLWPLWRGEYAHYGNEFVLPNEDEGLPAGLASDFTAYAQVRFNADRLGFSLSFVLTGLNPENVTRDYVDVEVWGILTPPEKSPFPEIDW